MTTTLRPAALNLSNALGEVILLHDDMFSMNTPIFERRNSIVDRYSQNGGVQSSDRCAKVRSIVLAFNLTATQDDSYRDVLNSLAYHFRPYAAPFYLHDSNNGIRTQVEYETMTPDQNDDGRLRFRVGVANAINLSMINALWEDDAENSVSQVSLSDGAQFTIDNISKYDCGPIIEVTADDVITDFTITNATTGAAIRIQSIDFLDTDVYTIDMVAGTIYLGGVESSISLISGGFWYLTKGNNIIQYNSPDGACDVRVRWRGQYAY